MNTEEAQTLSTDWFSVTRSSVACDVEEFTSDIFLYEGDCLELLKSLPSEAVELIITSPPYNIGKSYENQTSLQSYMEAMQPAIAEMVRVLSPTGSLCWQVGNYVDHGEVYPLDIHFYPLFKSFGLRLRNRIVWKFNHGLHASKRFSGRYETILWFTKGDKYTFNLDSVRVPSKYPGKRHFKGAKKGQLSGNPLGKNPSDVWDIIQQDWEAEIWDIPNVKANHPEKTEHPCQFPVELVERCVLALTNSTDIVLDPYCGVGSTLIASVRHTRRAIGAEQMREYADIISNRLEKLKDGSLKIRPLGKPVHVPSGKEKISQIPLEWKSKQ